MKVIVAGHQKTGTKTLNKALTLLGYNVYDFVENFFFLTDEWKQIFIDGASDELFQKMYKNVDAVCDLPCFIFWEEIHKAFPDAKIILSMRENEDMWFESLKNQILSNNSNFFLRLACLFSPSAVSKFVFIGGRAGCIAYGVPPNQIFPKTVNETLARLSYRRHNAHVLMNAPKDKLLVYNCKEGWEPLCNFLEVDVPDEPFPHKNKSASIFDELMKANEVMVSVKREAIVVGSSLLVCVSIAVFGGLKYFRVI